MKCVRIFGLLTATVAALMAVVGTASATTITSSTGETPTIHAEAISKATLHNAIGTLACTSTITETIQSHGTGLTAKGNIGTLSFSNCVGGTVHSDEFGMVATPGSLEFHSAGKTGNGFVTSTGLNITVTMFGLVCGYATNSTQLGEVIAGTHTVIKMAASIPRTHGSVFCGANGNLTGEYKFTHPTDFGIH